MKIVKKLLAVLLVVSLMVPTFAFAASSSATVTDISGGKMKVATSTYTKKSQAPSITVTVNGKVLKQGTDYQITKGASRRKAGYWTVKVKGIGNYKGTLSAQWHIKRISNTIKVTGNKSVKASTLKKKSVSYKMKVSRGGTGKITYKCSSKKVTLTQSSSGKTIKVKLKKGTYTKGKKYKITITTAATRCYKKTTKTIYVRIK